MTGFKTESDDGESTSGVGTLGSNDTPSGSTASTASNIASKYSSFSQKMMVRLV